MMKNNKGLVITTIILGVLVVAMGGYIVYDNFNKKEEIAQPNINENVDNNNSTESIKYTYDNVKGLYKYTSETMKDEYGNEYTAFYNLYLYENGTFNYRMGTMAPYGYMGNYISKDNTIVLNYLFSTNSGAGIDVTTGSKTITITDKDTLVDVDQSINMVNMTSVTLEKASSTEESEFLQGNDFSNILKNYHITNNVPNN